MAKVKSVLSKLAKMNITVTPKFENTVHTFTAGNYLFSVHGRCEEAALFDMRLGNFSVICRNPTMSVFIGYVQEAIQAVN